MLCDKTGFVFLDWSDEMPDYIPVALFLKMGDFFAGFYCIGFTEMTFTAVIGGNDFFFRFSLGYAQKLDVFLRSAVFTA